jgi:hypothetical protein
MHVTDFHPDPFYKRKATLESGCHRLKGESRVDRFWPTREGDDDDIEAGEWGTPIS